MDCSALSSEMYYELFTRRTQKRGHTVEYKIIEKLIKVTGIALMQELRTIIKRKSLMLRVPVKFERTHLCQFSEYKTPTPKVIANNCMEINSDARL